jgi:hypothetical protein
VVPRAKPNLSTVSVMKNVVVRVFVFHFHSILNVTVLTVLLLNAQFLDLCFRLS